VQAEKAEQSPYPTDGPTVPPEESGELSDDALVREESGGLGEIVRARGLLPEREQLHSGTPSQGRHAVGPAPEGEESLIAEVEHGTDVA